MAELQARSLDSPDKTMTFDNGTAELMTLAGSTVGRFTFQPGWRWSESLKKLVGTESCQTHHVGYAMAGHLHVRTDDGDEQDIRAGDAYNTPYTPALMSPSLRTVELDTPVFRSQASR
jgi:hypothetical protein